jgi:hypothetical protein
VREARVDEERIKRMLWRAVIGPENRLRFEDTARRRRGKILDLVSSGVLLHLGLYRWEQHVFLYYEDVGPDPGPETLFPEASGFLESWPGETEPRLWIRLVDVFHFNEPAGLEHWRRKRPVERRVGQIGRLRPETIPRYLFYHYALQEEQAFPGDKYEIIGLNEDLIFAYRERPEDLEPPPFAPRLRTKAVPADWSEAGIPSCFVPWPDLPGVYLRPMGEILTL